MRWNLKPPAGTLIDPAHPLAPGLIGAWTINEGVGMRLVNAASPGLYDMGPYTAGGSWVTGPSGLAYQTSSSFFTAGVIGGIDNIAALTLFLKGNWTNYFSSGRSGGSYQTMNLLGNPSGVLTASISTNTGSATVGVLGECSLAMVFNGAGAANSDRLKVYANGKPVALTFSGTIPTTLPPSSGYLWYLGAQRFLSSDVASRRDLDLLWTRALSDGEIAAVHGMPWDLYRPSPGWSDAEMMAYYYGATGRPIIRAGSPNIGPCVFESAIVGGYW